jgi:hypothetical protein
VDPDAGDITLNLLAEFLGAVEVAATGPPDSPCQSPATVAAAPSATTVYGRKPALRPVPRCSEHDPNRQRLGQPWPARSACVQAGGYARRCRRMVDYALCSESQPEARTMLRSRNDGRARQSGDIPHRGMCARCVRAGLRIARLPGGPATAAVCCHTGGRETFHRLETVNVREQYRHCSGRTG